MHKNVLFVCCILFFCCSSNIFKEINKPYVKKDDDMILWLTKRKLVWDDFRGIPDTSRTNVGAVTQGAIEIIDSNWENEIPKYKIGCFFIKSKSWTRVNDSYSLAHEQLHFDIAELFARKIRKAFDSLNVKKNKDNERYQDIYNFYVAKSEKYQDLYDNQVYFNDFQQQQWIKKVGLELARLKKYEYISENN